MKPNCSNCPHSKIVKRSSCVPKLAECVIVGYELDQPERDFISKIGCLSHPNAREYLMRDVIAELERLYQLALSDDNINSYIAYDRAKKIADGTWKP